jgi:hypothetical protein
MNTNYCQIVGLTDEQKREMYNKCTKKQLIDFIIQKEKYETIIPNTDTLKHYQDLGYTICTT